MPNPFFFGGHITDPAKFVGRKAELRRIVCTLDTAEAVQVVGVAERQRVTRLSHLTTLTPQDHA